MVICVAVTAVLAVVNGVTAEPIAKLAEEQASETRSIVLPSAEEYQKLELDNEDIFECYEGLKMARSWVIPLRVQPLAMVEL